MEESTRDSKFLFHLLYFLLVMFARILIYLLLVFLLSEGVRNVIILDMRFLAPSVSIKKQARKLHFRFTKMIQCIR